MKRTQASLCVARRPAPTRSGSSDPRGRRHRIYCIPLFTPIELHSLLCYSLLIATSYPKWSKRPGRPGSRSQSPKVTSSGEAATAPQHVCYLHSCDVRTHHSVQRRTTGTRHTVVQYNKYKHYENEEILLIYIIFYTKCLRGCFNNQEFIFDPPLKDFQVWYLHWICIINVWLFFKTAPRSWRTVGTLENSEDWCTTLTNANKQASDSQIKQKIL